MDYKRTDCNDNASRGFTMGRGRCLALALSELTKPKKTAPQNVHQILRCDSDDDLPIIERETSNWINAALNTEIIYKSVDARTEATEQLRAKYQEESTACGNEIPPRATPDENAPLEMQLQKIDISERAISRTKNGIELPRKPFTPLLSSQNQDEKKYRERARPPSRNNGKEYSKELCPYRPIANIYRRQDLDSVIAKTSDPVSLLHLWCSVIRTTPGVYLMSDSKSRKPSFDCRINVLQFTTYGRAYCKKMAKKIAAEKMLRALIRSSVGEELSPNGVLGANVSSNKSTSEDSVGAVSTKEEMLVSNPIGLLQEICMKQKWGFPDYKTELCERAFKCAVTLHIMREKVSAIGVGYNKKNAKHMAASNMLELCQAREFIPKSE